MRFGFRTSTKAHWDKLNTEYLAYRQKLLDELAAVDQEARHTAHADVSAAPAAMPEPEPAQQVPISREPVLDLYAPYPPGCLAYVRNVHPETNKTTLRKLFAQAFQDSGPPGPSGDGIDYVDFNKGMDTVSRSYPIPATH